MWNVLIASPARHSHLQPPQDSKAPSSARTWTSGSSRVSCSSQGYRLQAREFDGPDQERRALSEDKENHRDPPTTCSSGKPPSIFARVVQKSSPRKQLRRPSTSDDVDQKLANQASKMAIADLPSHQEIVTIAAVHNLGDSRSTRKRRGARAITRATSTISLFVVMVRNEWRSQSLCFIQYRH